MPATRPLRKKQLPVISANNLIPPYKEYEYYKKDMILIKENAKEMIDSLVGFQLPEIDKWDDFKNGVI